MNNAIKNTPHYWSGSSLIRRLMSEFGFGLVLLLWAGCGPAGGQMLDLRMVPELTITAGPGVYAVQYAQVLGGTTNWILLSTVTNTGATAVYYDTTAPSPARRFYRTVVLARGDNFEDNAKNTNWWGADVNMGTPGQVNEINGRLEFSSFSSGEQFAIRPWITGYGSYTNDWEVRADLNLGSVALTVNGSHVEMFLAAWNTGDIVGGFPRDICSVALDLYRDNGGTVFRTFTPYVRTNGVEVGSSTSDARPATATMVAVRITFASATKTLTLYGDDDGPANGYVWTLLRSSQINVPACDWNMANNGTFQFGLGGSSEGFVVNTAHAVFTDNFLATGANSP